MILIAVDNTSHPPRMTLQGTNWLMMSSALGEWQLFSCAKKELNWGQLKSPLASLLLNVQLGSWVHVHRQRLVEALFHLDWVVQRKDFLPNTSASPASKHVATRRWRNLHARQSPLCTKAVFDVDQVDYIPINLVHWTRYLQNKHELTAEDLAVPWIYQSIFVLPYGPCHI